MENANIEDISAYMNLLESAKQEVEMKKVQTGEDMDLDEIDDRIKILEDFNAIIEDRIESLKQQRKKRLDNVKMLRRIPLKNNKIAC